MNKKEINTEYNTWLTKLSKYIISRSSRLISPETQKDGRILLQLSALSSLFYLGLIEFENCSTYGFNVKDSIIFIPVIIEIVCLYFALSFIIDAYSDLKIWQFKTLIEESDDENTLSVIKRSHEDIYNKGKEIIKKYEELIVKVSKDFKLDKTIDPPPNTKDINQLRKFSKEMEDRLERQKIHAAILENFNASQQEELKELNIEQSILDFKLKSLNLEIPNVVRVYKFKLFIIIFLPLFSFLLSIAALIFYLAHYL